MGFENGVQIQAGDAQLLQIGQFLLNALQVPSKKSVLGDLPCSLGAHTGCWDQIAVERPARGDVLLGLLGLVEPVGEDLVHHAAFQPVGGLEVFVVHRQLPLVVAAEDAVPGKATGEPLAAPVVRTSK